MNYFGFLSETNKPSLIQGSQMVLQIFNNKMHLTCIILFNHIQLKKQQQQQQQWKLQSVSRDIF